MSLEETTLSINSIFLMCMIKKNYGNVFLEKTRFVQIHFYGIVKSVPSFNINSIL